MTAHRPFPRKGVYARMDASGLTFRKANREDQEVEQGKLKL
jgi:hypothetical protein